jgi:hypothetical protein
MTAPSQTPARFFSGLQTDQKWGPLAQMGMVNPFFYNLIYDDFDSVIANDELWTIYSKSTGGVANVSGDGGQITFTTAATSADVESIQSSTGVILLPPSTTPKKVFFLTRLKMSDITNSTVIAGLLDVTATPNLTITDGIYFSITAGGINAYIDSGSAHQATIAIPAAIISLYLANATFIDLGFYVSRNQDVEFFVGYPLVGYQLASAWTSATQPPPAGAVAAYRSAVSGALTFSTVVLAPTLVLSAGAAAVKTMTADFLMAAKER